MSQSEKVSNILVVEDEWLIAIDIKMIIEDQGHQVVGCPASNVAAAMKLIEAHQIDAAFLDITLETENSYPIAGKLDALSVPFAFVSAYARKEIPSQFAKFDLLPKPLTFQGLVRQMDKMLKKSQ